MLIPLSNQPASAIVDKSIYRQIKHASWSCNNVGYAQGRIDGQTWLMHRWIMKAQKGQEIDHINRNKLDNRRSNLRFATRSENMMNSNSRGGKYSKYVGVTFRPDYAKKAKKGNAKVWVAQISVGMKRNVCLGYFRTEEEAARRYDDEARKLRGDHARTNFPSTI